MVGKHSISSFSIAISLSVVSIGAVGIQSDGGENDEVPNTDRGKQVYEKYCASCHGLDGKGEGPAAVYLFPKPRDFTSGVFKFQSTPSGTLPTDEDLHRTIRNGMPGSAMPSWDRLIDQERSDLIAYIKTFSERFATEEPSGALTIGKEPPPTPEMIRDGKAVYALMSCWACHGKTGAGDGPASMDLVDDLGRPIPPYNFTRAGTFKGGGTPTDIFRTFTTGIGGTPMPGYGEDALTMTKESFSDLSGVEGQYSPSEIQEIGDFIAQLPTEEEINRLSDGERKSIADKRRWSLVYYVLSLAQSDKSQVSYTTKDRAIASVLVDRISQFADPAAGGWQAVKEVELALISLWQRDTPIDRVLVRSVTDGKEIAFRLEWEDSTKDDYALYNAKFGDAAAIQFPLDPTSDPFFAMGDTSFVVNIWHWKSWWEKDLKEYAGVLRAFPDNTTDFYPFDVSGGSRIEYFVSKDSAKNLSMPWNAGWGSGNLLSAQVRISPVEDLNARGFGTLTSQAPNEQNVRGKGVWKEGKWAVVFIRNLESTKGQDAVLKPGTMIPIAFAVWDGSEGDRDGQKMVTNWYHLTIGTK